MQREIDEMRKQLVGYIEATYHLSHPKTVAIRRDLLARAGGISQEPYVESTPTYIGDRPFSKMTLPQPVRSLLTDLADTGLLFDPPYQHQAEALELVMSAGAAGKGIVVTTGTGSGKTESFLLPVLARLADEASARPQAFKTRAVRALLLYPMNALVNDQLGRLRTLFGDGPVREWFERVAHRPAKFGRYTGRTLYPGNRDADRDKVRLKSLSYYLDLEDAARGGDMEKADLVDVLKRKGRWPAKPDSAEGAYDGLRGWYGSKTTRWVNAQGGPNRAVERLQDGELLTRHEMQDACPDLLVTNYSMLEYMLLRPIERSLFDETRAYFEKHPDEKFIFVLDEAHLYRGANGTEVAYLIRRFLDRLQLDASRVTFICTSASFSVPDAAKQFAAQLIGIDPAMITVLNGCKRLEPDAAAADAAATGAFASTPLEALLSDDPAERAEVLKAILAWRPLAEPRPVFLQRLSGPSSSVQVHGLDSAGRAIDETVIVAAGDPVETTQKFAIVTSVDPAEGSIRFGRPADVVTGRAAPGQIHWINDDLARAAWLALKGLPVVGALKNITTGAAAETDPAVITGSAKSLSQLADTLFGGTDERSLRAIDALIELTSLARAANDKAPLLPARVHLMFRGLPGLWACVDPNCSVLREDLRGGPTGSLYAEPRRHCLCRAQVFELWSCRSCGIAVAHAFVGSPAGDQHLWADDGAAYSDDAGVVQEAYIFLEDPGPTASTPLSAADLDVLTGRLDGGGARTRPVWCNSPAQGVFDRCPRCDANKQISDLQTKGDEPFQQLVAVQVLSQPPRPESNAPLKGRKTLVFSDGRQTASRLAGLLKTFAFRDSVRPLLLDGMAALTASPYEPSLDDAPLAVSLSAAMNQVRIRPVDDRGDYVGWGRQADDLLKDPDVEEREVGGLSSDTSQATPGSVFQSLYAILQDRHTGLSALALASVGPKLPRLDRKAVDALPLPSLPGYDDDAIRQEVLRLWLWCALDRHAIKLSATPIDVEVDRWSGKFGERVTRALKAAGHGAWLPGFTKTGVPILRTVFSGSSDSTFQISARKVALLPGDSVTWRRCGTCTLVSPENLLLGAQCPSCNGRTEIIDPGHDQVFRSRKAFFRHAAERMADHTPGSAPHQLVAEEHSAQLNDSNAVRAMSRNEAYELRFQDVPVAQTGQPSDPIDVLSCTTTMEVGIDIGGLTAVALRNVPPGRANYQQRAGRAGRRGAGLSTVVMFCGADSHDQSFFRDPAPIVAGPAPDPVLNLNNRVIAERQAFAFLLGRFQQARVVNSSNPNIFESLGSTHAFLTGDAAGFSLAGLRQWLIDNRARLAGDLTRLFTASCPGLAAYGLLDQWPDLLEEKLGLAAAQVIESVVEAVVEAPADDDDNGDYDDLVESDAPDNDKSGAGSSKLLDQLFALGLMPRYAFPTDVATFAVFEEHPDPYRPQLAYSPQQSLNAALAQYAPGRSVWIDGKTHLSMGVWSNFDNDRWEAYQERKLYYHCQICDFATLKPRDQGRAREFITCPACNTPSGMGPAQHWLRPVGFANPPGMPAAPPRIDGTVNSRPTRAKLDAPHFKDELRIGGAIFDNQAGWEAWRENLDLVVTNRGTQSSTQQGFRHCPKCGRTEPADLDANLAQLGPGSAGHARPRPTKPKEVELCDGTITSLVLGNQFKTDIAVLRLQAPPAWDLSPDRPATIIAAKSAVEALIRAASRDLEPGDIDGDYRFAPGRSANTLLDLYIYDQAAGGAGFVKAAAADPERLVRAALDVLDDCTCEDSCYQCLRSYKNRFDHGLLDRRLGADLLRACFEGREPVVPEAWASGALTRLLTDVEDAGGDYVQQAGGLINADGRAIVVGHPFTPDTPGNASAAAFAAAAKSAKVVDVLMVDRGLPLATALALDTTKTSAPPPSLSADGPLLVTVDAVLDGKVPTSGARVAVGAFEPGDFVMKLEAHTLGGKLGDGTAPVRKGTYCLFRPQGAAEVDPKQVYLLRRRDGATFGATHQRWTVGSVQSIKDGLRVRYRAAPERLECASEVVAAGALEAIALFVRQVK